MTETNNQQNNQETQETLEMQNNNVVEETVVDDMQQNNEQQEYQQEIYQQQTYQQPVYQQPAVTKPGTSKTISILDWIFTIIVMSIPVVNIIMLFVFAFAGENEWYKTLKLASVMVSTTLFPAFTVFLLKQLGFAGKE